MQAIIDEYLYINKTALLSELAVLSDTSIDEVKTLVLDTAKQCYILTRQPGLDGIVELSHCGTYKQYVKVETAKMVVDTRTKVSREVRNSEIVATVVAFLTEKSPEIRVSAEFLMKYALQFSMSRPSSAQDLNNILESDVQFINQNGYFGLQ
jgi:hypothetical protein